MNRAADDLRVHREFLLELLGVPRVDDAELQRRALVVDWRVLMDEAGLALHPMLAVRLDERGIRAPEWVRERVQWALRSNAMVLARRHAEFNRVFATLDSQQIPFVVLKGFALAHLVYPAPEARTMNDVDLWVQVRSLRSVMRALEPLGWRPPWWRQKDTSLLGDDDEVAIRYKDTPLLAELHRNPLSFVNSVPHSLEAIWSRRVPARLDRSLCHVLCDEDMILHLALHVAERHRFVHALTGLLDVTLVVDAAGVTINWPSFAERCISLGVAGWVATVLGTSVRLLGARVPADALDAFQIADLDRLCKVACEQIWANAKTGDTPTSVTSAPIGRVWLALVIRRVRDTITGGDVTSLLTPPGMLRLFRRLRYFAQYSLKRQVLAIVRVRSATAIQARRSSAQSAQLRDDMARAGLVARIQGSIVESQSAHELG